jgi:hypothetical protein
MNKKIYEDAKKSLSNMWSMAWYWKVLVCFLAIGLVVLWIMSLFDTGVKDMSGVDEGMKDMTQAELDALQAEEEQIDKRIADKKVEIATKLNQARDIDATTMDNREKILKATTMEELDALQKKLGL